MLEQLYDAIQGILFWELPKNAQNQTVVFNKVIKGWQFGDRTIQDGIPSITLFAQSSHLDKIGFGTERVEHTMQISVKTGSDSTEISERDVLEMARLMREAMLPHQRIWACTACPICLQRFLSPEHFLLVHDDIFGPFADAATAAQNAVWALTKSDSPPTWDADRIATVAFYNVYAQVKAGTPVANLTGTPLANMQVALANSMRPIVLIDDLIYSEIEPSDQGKEQKMLHEAKFTFKGKEIIRVPAFGPSNVPTDTWTKSMVRS